ncbi:MAG: LacI family DNA-binding transcriptional regulator [Elusimicrobiota bacterium]
MDKKIRIKDIAKALRVSPTAVSFALNNKSGISPELKEKIFEYATQSGYIRGMSPLKSEYIAEMSAVSDSSILIHAGITGVLKRNGFFALRHTFYGDELLDVRKQQIAFDRILSEDGIKGLIVVFLSLSETFLNKINKKKIPIVQINGNSHIGINLNIDEEHGGYIAAKQLIEYGHRKICFIFPDYWYDNIWNRRKAGYKKALDEAGIEYDVDLIEPENLFTVESAGRATMNLIKRNTDMTAIIYVSDKQALGGMKVMAQNGVKVPDDISVIGFDNTYFCDISTPTLSSIEMQFEKCGSMAAEYLVNAVRKNSVKHETTILRPTLVLRDSVKIIGNMK